MKKLVCFISILFLSINAYCQQPHVQSLNGLAQVTFPDSPKTVHNAGTLYVYKDGGRNIYMAQYSKLEKGLKDYMNQHLTDSIYDGYIRGLTSTSNAQVFYREPITVQGLHGLNFDYKMLIGGKPYWCYHHVFYLNDAVISYCYWSPDSLARNDQKIQAYFGTFKLLVKPGSLNFNSSERIAYKAGEVIGVLLIFGILAGIVILIVFLIRRANKKKQITFREYNDR